MDKNAKEVLMNEKKQSTTHLPTQKRNNVKYVTYINAMPSSWRICTLFSFVPKSQCLAKMPANQ